MYRSLCSVCILCVLQETATSVRCAGALTAAFFQCVYWGIIGRFIGLRACVGCELLRLAP
jgi:hypothetical protein